MARNSDNYPSYEVPGEDFDPKREVEEAIDAGEKALVCLNRASKSLQRVWVGHARHLWRWSHLWPGKAPPHR